MSSGGKGGSGDSGIKEMLQYGNKALALQEKQYDTQRADAQPWYQTGVGAVNQLSNLLGIKTNTTKDGKTREQIYQELTPNYTTTTSSGGGGMSKTQLAQLQQQAILWPNKFGGLYEQAKAAQNPTTTSSIDYDALNKRADELYNQNLATDANAADFGRLTQGFDLSKFQEDPGYQFRLAEGQKALDRQLNARGKTYSPEAAKALMGYNQDMGSQEYNNSFNRYNIENDNLFNRLATLSGFGQTASGQIANAGSNYANAGSDIFTGMGNSIAAQKQAQQANNSSMFGSLLGAGAQLGSAYLLSDMRLKENITPIGKENGHKIYTFNYRGDHVPMIGVMAQEVMETNPDAVKLMDNGFYAVDYDKIGVKFRSAISDT